jgi:hypothetical protein
VRKPRKNERHLFQRSGFRKVVSSLIVQQSSGVKRQLAENTTDSCLGTVKRVKHSIDQDLKSIRDRFFPVGQISTQRIASLIEEKKLAVCLMEAKLKLARLELLQSIESSGDGMFLSGFIFCGVLLTWLVSSSWIEIPSTTESRVDALSLTSDDMSFNLDSLLLGSSSGLSNATSSDCLSVDWYPPVLEESVIEMEKLTAGVYGMFIFLSSCGDTNSGYLVDPVFLGLSWGEPSDKNLPKLLG